MIKLAKKSFLISFVLLLTSLSVCLAQNGSMSNYTKDGKLISEGGGAGNNISGEFKLTAYRLEVIDLAKPFDLKDGKPPIETAFRLVLITKDKLPPGDFSIWIDDSPHTAIRTQPNELTILLYSRTLPNQALVLGLSKRGRNDVADRSVLADTLNVPSEYATPQDVTGTTDAVVKLRRVPPANRIIEVWVEVPGLPCREKDVPIFIEIDGYAHDIFCSGNAFVNWLSPEQFARLRNGAQILLKKGVGRESRLIRTVGNLNKNSLP
jgi:hypothetical protein